MARGCWDYGAVGVVLILGCVLGGALQTVEAREFIVNSMGDQSDAFPGDGVAEISPGSAITTLRAAIEEANAFPGPDTIVVTGSTIQLKTALPPLSDMTGGTTIRGKGSTHPTRGSFPYEVVGLAGGTHLDGNTLDRQAPGYSSVSGLRLESPDNLVEGITVVRFPKNGIEIVGPQASGNIVRSTYIGIREQTVLGNGAHGIFIADGASNNTIGGPMPEHRNVVADNGMDGIHLSGDGTDGNRVVNNFIGVDVLDLPVCARKVLTGNEPMTDICQDAMSKLDCIRGSFPNRRNNIGISAGARNNTVGDVGLGNIITGSLWRATAPCDSYIHPPYCTVDPNIQPTSGPGKSGIVIEGTGTEGNRVCANLIGSRQFWAIWPDGDGYRLIDAFSRSGVVESSIVIQGGAAGNEIGGAGEALGNTIDYSLQPAVVLSGAGTASNRVLNNSIHGEKEGVAIFGAASNNVIGSSAGWGNTIRSRQFGVDIFGTGTLGNHVVGNDVFGNGFSGVAIHGGASANIVGGTNTGDGNRISGNCSDGVILFDPGTNQNQILGNEIANNGEIGVFMVNGASDNIIGGGTIGAGNDIHGNEVTGVEIHDISSTGNQILGNEIHNNGTRGIFMVDGTSGNTVGGVAAPERNRVYNNGLAGIEINGAATRENRIRINSIYDNEEKGILLSFGANEEIVPPHIATFIPFAGTAPPHSFVDIFSDAAEEGRNYIGSTTADSEGNFSVLLNLSTYRNTNLTTTATDALGNTSEFSAPIAIVAPTFTDTPDDRVIVVGDSLDLAVTVAGSPEIHLQWRFRPDGGDYSTLEDDATYLGVTSPTLILTNGQMAHEGYYQCVADNGLGAVNSREIFLRVVPADLRELDVNTLSDVSDGATSSFARLLASPGVDGKVSLREAIAAANTMAGENTIRFSVEGVFAVESDLPAIADPTGGLYLDGGGVVSLDGSAMAGSGSGIVVTSAGNTIKGLGLWQFPENGIVLSGPGATGNTILGCRIGTDGTEVRGNGLQGIFLTGGAAENQIGGTGGGDGNQIAGHGETGITLTGNGTRENRVEGNAIGWISPDLPGTGNALAGVRLMGRASDNTIGGEEAGAGNTIAGNTGIGVWVVAGGTAGNTIRNNTIYANGDLGIRLFDGGNNGVVRPVVTSLAPLVGTAPANSTVDCYADGHDEGEIFLFTLIADGDGVFGMDVDLHPYDGLFFTAIATDAAGNTSAFSQPVGIDFTPPELTLNGNAALTLACGLPFTDPGATAMDAIDGDISDRIVVEITDGEQRSVSDLAAAPPGVYMVRYTVSDAAGLAAEPVTRTVAVVDTTVPTLVLHGDATFTLACGTPFDDPGASGVDDCAGDVAVTVTGTVDHTQPGTYLLTYHGEDASGNAAAPVTRSVTVVDGTRPVIALLGEPEMTMECGAPYTDPGATAMDACSGGIAVTATGTVDTARAGTYIVKYNASDGSGNRAETLQRVVTVVDTTAPVLTLHGAAEVSLRCGEAYAEAGAALSDSCDPGTDVVISGDFDSNVAGVYVRRYDATDTAGNMAEPLFRTITVIGENPPAIFLTGEASVTIACNTVYQDAGARAQDGCLADITADLIVESTVDTAQAGTYTVTYSVVDGAGVAAPPVTRSVTVLPCVGPCDAQCDGDPDDAIDEDGDGLSRCKEACVGTSDRNPDSDGDGMPDGFEYVFRLNPTLDDADLDADGDGTTNIDEYLEGSSPRSAATPRTVFYVSPSGSDTAAAGTMEHPWKSITYALSRVSPTAAKPVRLFLAAGLYVENVTVKAYVELRAATDSEVEIMGSVILSANSALQGVVCTSDATGAGLVFMEGAATMRHCVLNGEFGTALTGVVVEAGSVPGIIEDTHFMTLNVGIDVSGALPAVRRCTFTALTDTAILLREGMSTLPGDQRIGQGLNGWNDFGALGGGLAIRNESSLSIVAQWNDWGTDRAGEQAALIEGAVNQDNALDVGSADTASRLDIVVFNGATQARTGNATVTATGPSGTLTARTGSDGRVAFPTLPAGIWQVTVAASGYPDVTVSATLQAGVRHVVNAVLFRDDGEVPPPPPPSSCNKAGTPGAPEDRAGDLFLMTLLMAGLVSGRIRRLGKN